MLLRKKNPHFVVLFVVGGLFNHKKKFKGNIKQNKTPLYVWLLVRLSLLITVNFNVNLNCKKTKKKY